MKNVFNDTAPRAQAMRLMEEWGVEYTILPSGILLVEGADAFPREKTLPTDERKLARALSKELYGDRDALILLSMNEYAEKHEVSKLIGAPPGYVGFDSNDGTLTDRVLTRPQSLIFLDEVEKGHPALVQLIDEGVREGKLTDNKGRNVSLDGALVVEFSNAVSAATLERRGGAQLILRRDMKVSPPLRFAK